MNISIRNVPPEVRKQVVLQLYHTRSDVFAVCGVLCMSAQRSKYLAVLEGVVPAEFEILG